MNLEGIFKVTKKSISFMTMKLDWTKQWVGKKICQGYLVFVEMMTFRINMKNMGKCYLTSMNGCGGSSSKIDLWSLSNLPHLWQFEFELLLILLNHYWSVTIPQISYFIFFHHFHYRTVPPLQKTLNSSPTEITKG